MCLLTLSATGNWPKMPKSFEFSNHGHIRDSQYPFESGAVGAFPCFTNPSLFFFRQALKMTRLYGLVILSMVWAFGLALEEISPDACDDMVPGYNQIPRADVMPFSITTSQDSYRADDIING